MSFEKIKQYYLLCTVKNGGNKRHIISDLKPEHVIKMFPKKELNTYYTRVDNGYIIKETIIGGNDEVTRGLIIVI